MKGVSNRSKAGRFLHPTMQKLEINQIWTSRSLWPVWIWSCATDQPKEAWDCPGKLSTQLGPTLTEQLIKHNQFEPLDLALLTRSKCQPNNINLTEGSVGRRKNIKFGKPVRGRSKTNLHTLFRTCKKIEWMNSLLCESGRKWRGYLTMFGHFPNIYLFLMASPKLSPFDNFKRLYPDVNSLKS